MGLANVIIGVSSRDMTNGLNTEPYDPLHYRTRTCSRADLGGAMPGCSGGVPGVV